MPTDEIAEATSVLLPWVMEMPWKMQSILLSGLRAPDVKSTAVKSVCRWMRSICQNNADPSKGYMEPQKFDQFILTHLMDELEYMPCHYVHHFADAMRVVAIYHPIELLRLFAMSIHEGIAEEIFHFKAESLVEFTHRHRDMIHEYPPDCTCFKGSNDPLRCPVHRSTK